jgi:predicted nicotinamide N-methyase
MVSRAPAGVQAAHLIAVCAATSLSPTPLVPEVDLYVAEDTYSVWELTTHTDAEGEPPVPFWSFPWPGGQALARYLLDNRSLLAGRRVLDLAAGSGLVGIAAAIGGAANVTTVDVDPFAAAAQTMNAGANEVQLEIVLADILDADASGYDVVVAGDVCYEREFTDRILGFLRRARTAGADVLLGDPGRTYLPATGLTATVAYDVPTTLALEDSVTKHTTVWRLV